VDFNRITAPSVSSPVESPRISNCILLDSASFLFLPRLTGFALTELSHIVTIHVLQIDGVAIFQHIAKLRGSRLCLQITFHVLYYLVENGFDTCVSRIPVFLNYSNPKSFVNFLLPPRTRGEGWGGVKIFMTPARIAINESQISGF